MYFRCMLGDSLHSGRESGVEDGDTRVLGIMRVGETHYRVSRPEEPLSFPNVKSSYL